MANPRKAVIDIGTNTVHLLIAAVKDINKLRILYKERHYTYLGENGLDLIGIEPTERLYKALEKYEKHIRKYHVTRVKVLATDALRSAKNGIEIQNKIIARYGWYPEIISGEKEAELITKGVEISLDTHISDYLIILLR